MKPLNKTFALWILLLTALPIRGQLEQYNYKRELKGISEIPGWYSLSLPEDLYSKVSHTLADLRVYGLTTDGDTLEAPYLLQRVIENTVSTRVPFTTLNTSHNARGHFFTFDVPDREAINQIHLDFAQDNFDWQAHLQGSDDRNEWFTVLEDYRILSIKNDRADFRFTTLNFPDTKYRYFRLHIPASSSGDEKPILRSASLLQNNTIPGSLRDYSVKTVQQRENKTAKQTELTIELPLLVPVSHLKIAIRDTLDYYRPIQIQYLRDSIQTEQGWRYQYSTLTNGTLHSLGENEFQFTPTATRQLKVTIRNHDNTPLTLDTPIARGYVDKLVTRFADSASYFLAYGNPKATKLHYDLDHFVNKLSETPIPLELGSEQSIEKGKLADTPAPLFSNKGWLWGIMLLIIGLLGWFTIRMMKGKGA